MIHEKQPNCWTRSLERDIIPVLSLQKSDEQFNIFDIVASAYSSEVSNILASGKNRQIGFAKAVDSDSDMSSVNQATAKGFLIHPE